MALVHGSAPRRFRKGNDKEAYEIAASRGYSHACMALACGGAVAEVGGIPTGLKNHWAAWQAGWEAGVADARADHQS